MSLKLINPLLYFLIINHWSIPHSFLSYIIIYNEFHIKWSLCKDVNLAFIWTILLECSVSVSLILMIAEAIRQIALFLVSLLYMRELIGIMKVWKSDAAECLWHWSLFLMDWGCAPGKGLCITATPITSLWMYTFFLHRKSPSLGRRSVIAPFISPLPPIQMVFRVRSM